LPSAIDHRPLRFEELEATLGRKKLDEVALDEAVRDGRIQRGQLLLLEAFGGGWTWGSALVRF